MFALCVCIYVCMYVRMCVFVYVRTSVDPAEPLDRKDTCKGDSGEYCSYVGYMKAAVSNKLVRIINIISNLSL